MNSLNFADEFIDEPPFLFVPWQLAAIKVEIGISPHR